jgi:hypothetical protein
VNVIRYAQALRLAFLEDYDNMDILNGIYNIAMRSKADSRVPITSELANAVAAAAVPAADESGAYDQLVQLLRVRLRDEWNSGSSSANYNELDHARQIAGPRPVQHVGADNNSTNSSADSGSNSNSMLAESVDATAGDVQMAQQIQREYDAAYCMDVKEETTTVKQSGDSINDITGGTSNESLIKERVSATESQQGVSYSNDDSTDTNSSKTMNIPDIDQVTTSITLYAVQLVRNICHSSFECSSLCSHRMSCILTTTVHCSLFTDH